MTIYTVTFYVYSRDEYVTVDVRSHSIHEASIASRKLRHEFNHGNADLVRVHRSLVTHDDLV